MGWEIWGPTPMSEVELLLHLRQLAEDGQGVQRGALRVGLRRATEADEGGERDLRDEARVDVEGRRLQTVASMPIADTEWASSLCDIAIAASTCRGGWWRW